MKNMEKSREKNLASFLLVGSAEVEEGEKNEVECFFKVEYGRCNDENNLGKGLNIGSMVC